MDHPSPSPRDRTQLPSPRPRCQKPKNHKFSPAMTAVAIRSGRIDPTAINRENPIAATLGSRSALEVASPQGLSNLQAELLQLRRMLGEQMDPTARLSPIVAATPTESCGFCGMVDVSSVVCHSPAPFASFVTRKILTFVNDLFMPANCAASGTEAVSSRRPCLPRMLRGLPRAPNHAPWYYERLSMCQRVPQR